MASGVVSSQCMSTSTNPGCGGMHANRFCTGFFICSLLSILVQVRAPAQTFAFTQAFSSVACPSRLRKCAHMRTPCFVCRAPPACGTGRAPGEAGHQSEITSLGTTTWLQQKDTTSLSLGDDLERVQHDLPNAGWCPAAWGRCCCWSWGWT